MLPCRWHFSTVPLFILPVTPPMLYDPSSSRSCTAQEDITPSPTVPVMPPAPAFSPMFRMATSVEQLTMLSDIAICPMRPPKYVSPVASVLSTLPRADELLMRPMPSLIMSLPTIPS